MQNIKCTITLEEYKQYYCDAFIKTLRLSEKIYYEKHYITWKKMKRIISTKDESMLIKNPACYRLYSTFWDNLKICKDSKKTALEYLMLSTQVNNVLRRRDINFIEELQVKSENNIDLCNLRNIGANAAKLIQDSLKNYSEQKKEELDKLIMDMERDDWMCIWEFERYNMKK